MKSRPLLPDDHTIAHVDLESEPRQEAGAIVATEDHALIRQWAERHSAIPATGEETASGPATLDVKDGGAGIRFNFPAAARFRPISWEEWLGNFTTYNLVFIYEREAPGEVSNGRYRLVPRTTLQEREGGA